MDIDINKRLYEACVTGQADLVKQLLSHGADVNWSVENQVLPIHLASQAGYTEVVGILLAHGAEVNGKTGQGILPIHIAAQNGHKEVVELLILHGAELNGRTSHGITAVFIAAQNGHKGVVEVLLPYGAEINKHRHQGKLPIHIAAENGHTDVVNLLLSNGAEVDVRADNSFTPLFLAAQNGHPEMVQALIDKGAKVTEKMQLGFMALHTACFNGHCAVVKTLLAHGAQVDGSTDDGTRPINIATENMQTEIMLLLLSNGADVNALSPNGLSPIHAAAFLGHKEMVDILLLNGADPNIRTPEGFLPLYIAAEQGYRTVVETLVTYGADVNGRTLKGFAPIYVAAKHGHVKIVQFLISSGADVNSQANNGLIPIHIASQNGFKEVVELLLAYGAEINGETNDKETSLDFACGHGKVDIVKMLLLHGADINVITKSGLKPIHSASIQGSKKIVDLLIAHGAQVDDRTDNGFMPMYLACENGHKRVVETLLEHGTDANGKSANGNSSIHIASKEGYADIVELLLMQGARVDEISGEGLAPIHIASNNKHTHIVKILLENNADASIRTKRQDGFAAIHMSCINGEIDIVELLLAHGAEVNGTSRGGFMPLYIACQHGHLEIVELLIQKGADINVRMSNGLFSLHAASSGGHADVVDLLLKHGVNVNQKSDEGEQAILNAALSGFTDVVKVLISHGTEVNAKTDSGYLPLHMAIHNGHLDVVKVLVSHGASLEQYGSYGYKAIHMSAQCGHVDILKYLENHEKQQRHNASANNAETEERSDKIPSLLVSTSLGEELTPLQTTSHFGGQFEMLDYLLQQKEVEITQDIFGRTALHIYYYSGKPTHMDRVIEKFITKEPRIVNMVDINGWSPLHLSIHQGDIEGTQFLLQNGADRTLKDIYGLTPEDLVLRPVRRRHPDEGKCDIMSNLLINNHKKDMIELLKQREPQISDDVEKRNQEAKDIQKHLTKAVKDDLKIDDSIEKYQLIGKLLTFPGLGMVNLNTESSHILNSQVKTFVRYIIQEINTLDSKLNITQELGGSSREHTKVGLPDESDIRLHIGGLEGGVSHVIDMDRDNAVLAIMNKQLRAKWEKFLNEDGVIQADKMSQHIYALQCKALANVKHLKKAGFYLIGTTNQGIYLEVATGPYQGMAYKFDLVTVVVADWWPDAGRKHSHLTTTLDRCNILLRPNCWKPSTCLQEGEIMSSLPRAHRLAYVLLKVINNLVDYGEKEQSEKVKTFDLKHSLLNTLEDLLEKQVIEAQQRDSRESSENKRESTSIEKGNSKETCPARDKAAYWTTGKDIASNAKTDTCSKRDQHSKMNENIDKGKKTSPDLDKEETFTDRGIKSALGEEPDPEGKMTGENKQTNPNRGPKEAVNEDKTTVAKAEMTASKSVDIVFDKADDTSLANELTAEMIDEISELAWSICDGHLRRLLTENLQRYYFHTEHCKYRTDGYNRFVSYVKYVLDKRDTVQLYRI